MRFLGKCSALVVACLVPPGLSAEPDASTGAIRVAITVDAAKPLGEWKPIWRFFGADEPNYACMKDGRKPLAEQLPIVIGESDPEGCAACREPRDVYRNGTMYSSYTAASFPRKLEIAARHGVNLEGALTWAFEFEDQPPFAGFRQLASAALTCRC